MKYFFLVCSFFLISCTSTGKLEQEIEQVQIEFEIIRFDKEFANAKITELADIKKKYPIFFPEQFHDSIWLYKMTDTLQQELNREVGQNFPNQALFEDSLYVLFQHVKYYFPRFVTPLVYTTTTDVDYNNKVVLSNDLLVIGLDNYLGSDHYFYNGIPEYISKNMMASQISTDVAAVYARQLVALPKTRSILAQMIYYGKGLYLKDIWLPDATNASKIGYTDHEYAWANENEVDIWRYFVENELLYSSDNKLLRRFIDPAPFTKFYLEIDNDSPGMIGRYIGWQIVRSYMENHNLSPAQLIALSADEIYQKSKYKPKK